MRMTHHHLQADAIRERTRNVREGVGAGAHEGRPQQQVLGRIAAQGQLRGQDEVRPLGMRTACGLDDLPGIALEVADGGVDLGQCDLHRHGAR